MLYEYRGRNIDISEQVKEAAEKKLNRALSKFFAEDAVVHITFKAETKKEAIAEITIPVQGSAPIRAEAKNVDKMEALDEAIGKIEKQIVRYRKKLTAKAKSDGQLKRMFTMAPEEDTGLEADEEMQIKRVKEIIPQMMDETEACLQMELLDHDFFVYRDQNTQQICVVYKRKEKGTYGLIITK